MQGPKLVIDFSLPQEVIERRDTIRDFVGKKIVPYERDLRFTQHGPSDDLRNEMCALAKEAGLLTFQAPAHLGGWGPSHVEQAVYFEAAGWSTLGPVALNCAAPDEGNMFLLEKIANETQTEEFLKPQIAGDRRSVFAMTEPGGAGSDPGQLQTTAQWNGERFVINGLKWLITGAPGAKSWIIMAHLEENDQFEAGPTLFLCDGDKPGIAIERVMNSIDRSFVEGHGVVRFQDLQLTPDHLLGETGQGLRYAQLRLAPARMTHCMRWLGAATRAHAIATDYARKRTAFGKPLGDHQGVSFMLAENEMAFRQCRLLIWHTCWLMDQGEKARHDSSIAKAAVSEALYQVTDRCVQILGGSGVTDETPVELIFRDMRAFRIYDGPTEVHKFAIGRKIMRDAAKAGDGEYVFPQ